jgi:hypothetical protein
MFKPLKKVTQAVTTIDISIPFEIHMLISALKNAIPTKQVDDRKVLEMLQPSTNPRSTAPEPARSFNMTVSWYVFNPAGRFEPLSFQFALAHALLILFFCYSRPCHANEFTTRPKVSHK